MELRSLPPLRRRERPSDPTGGRGIGRQKAGGSAYPSLSEFVQDATEHRFGGQNDKFANMGIDPT